MDLYEVLEEFLNRYETSRNDVLSYVLDDLEMWSWEEDFTGTSDEEEILENSQTFNALIALLNALKDS